VIPGLINFGLNDRYRSARRTYTQALGHAEESRQSAEERRAAIMPAIREAEERITQTQPRTLLRPVV